MKSFSASIDIEASPEIVWAVLVDTAQWTQFDPFTARMAGHAALNATLTAVSTLAPGRVFRVKITTFDPPKVLTWLNTGGMPLNLLKSVRTHTLTPRGAGSHFELTEVVSGPMLSMIGGALPDLTEPFVAFCHGLKAHVEAQS